MQEVEIVMKRVLDEQIIEAYGAYLLREEKSGATVEKYLRDVRGLACRCRGGRLQRKNPDHSGSGQAEKAVIELRQTVRYSGRYYLRDEIRKTSGQKQYLGTNETAVSGSRCQSVQGISP